MKLVQGGYLVCKVVKGNCRYETGEWGMQTGKG